MNLGHKVRAVERLFKSLEKDISKLQASTGLRCVENCIKCCTTPKIMATALEFYPLAMHLYKSGQAENVLTRIEQINNPGICPVLAHLSIDGSRPGCEHYAYRGLICRLFAFNYTVDKYNNRRISSCSPMQTGQAEALKKANSLLAKKPLGPKASNYYSRLQFIDFTESQQMYPIGEAIQLAIQKILIQNYYRGNKAV